MGEVVREEGNGDDGMMGLEFTARMNLGKYFKGNERGNMFDRKDPARCFVSAWTNEGRIRDE